MTQMKLEKDQGGESLLNDASEIVVRPQSIDLKVHTEEFGEVSVEIDKDKVSNLSEVLGGQDIESFEIVEIEVTEPLNMAEAGIGQGSDIGDLINHPVKVVIQKNRSGEANATGLKKPPNVPEVNEFSSKTNKRYYNMLFNDEENQAQKIRSIIYNRGSISMSELKDILEEEGYSSSSSGFKTCLRMLDKTTNEIERKHLENDNKETNIVWTGQE